MFATECASPSCTVQFSYCRERMRSNQLAMCSSERSRQHMVFILSELDFALEKCEHFNLLDQKFTQT
jgi:hypothetical protein